MSIVLFCFSEFSSHLRISATVGREAALLIAGLP